MPARTTALAAALGTFAATFAFAAFDLDLDDPGAPAAPLSLDDPADSAAKAQKGSRNDPRSTANGATADFYFNYFGETLPQLEAFVRDATPPDLTLRLPTAATRNPWNPNEKELVGRLCGIILHGWIDPEHDGEYRLIVSENGVPRRLFLALDGDPAHAEEVELVPMAKYSRAEKVITTERRDEWETTSRRGLATKPLELKSGKPCYFALHILTTYAGEGLDLTWAEVSGYDLRTDIPTAALRPFR